MCATALVAADCGAVWALLHHFLLDPEGQYCRLQRQYFREQEKLGKIQLRPPTPEKAKKSLQEKYGVPSHLEPMQQCPETAIALTFSRQLWGNAVPGMRSFMPHALSAEDTGVVPHLFCIFDWPDLNILECCCRR